jgi:hypothetical protein
VKTERILLMVFVTLMLAILACGPISEPTPTPTNTPVPPTATPRPSPTPRPTPVTCESLGDRASTVPIELGESYDYQMPASAGYYPSNCLYYCVGVPDSLGALDIGIENFSIDLNLYIGRGSIDVLNDSDVVDGSDWYSHHTVDAQAESVSIPAPIGDVYYIEVCSYDGRPGAFTLWTEGQ